MEETTNTEGNITGESYLATPNPPADMNFQQGAMIEDTNIPVSDDIPHAQVAVGSSQNKTIEPAETSEHIKEFNEQNVLIDTAAPFDSVKEAVSKFGGIIDWKDHKAMALEKRTNIQHELVKMQEEIPKYKRQSEAAQDAKARVLEELDSAKKLIEELKHNLEKSETEEAQAKQDSELSQLRVQEMQQGISDDASVAAKAQVEVVKARHEAAVEELKSVKEELIALQGDYHRLIIERDLAIKRDDETVSASKDAEKKVEDLTLELISTKEALDSAHASHLEAEEQRIAIALAKDQDSLNWEKELKQAQEELQELNNQHLSAEELKSKLDTASTLLLSLKTEFASYKDGRLVQDFEIIEEESETNKTRTSLHSELASAKKELEEVKASIEKSKDEVTCLRVAASSLKAELDREIETLTTLRQREGLTYLTVSSLEAELSRMQTELELVLTKEREAREKMDEMPKLIQQATLDADQAKSLAHLICEELRKAKEESEQAKAGESTMEVRLLAALKEIEAAKASEELSLAVVKAMIENEEQQGTVVSTGTESDAPPSRNGVTLQLEEYYTLSKNAHYAEKLANERVISAVEQVKEVKKSEQMSLEKLEAAHKELEEKKEALSVAMEMVQMANEGKLATEQELRGWRAENIQRRRASDAAPSHLEMNPSISPYENFAERGEQNFVNGKASLRVKSLSEPVINIDHMMPELKPRRKKSFFPRIVLFLAKKKAQSLK